jgi:uncharacterized protein
MPTRPPFQLGEYKIEAGTRQTVDLPVSTLSDHTPVSMSVHVIHGKKPGPTLFVSAAIHGDEVIGVEVVRRLLRTNGLNKLRGTLLAIPIVNSFGFMNHSRYLPDRRDLNRSFPGSPKGSLAARLADIFMEEIVARSDVGIDLHSASFHRTNLPQIRLTPSKPETMALAKAFSAPLILTSKIRPNSLRQAAQEKGVDILVYEAGEGLRFDEMAARVGTAGIIQVMRHLEMLPAKSSAKAKVKPILSSSSSWVRAPAGGLLRMFKSAGEEVKKGDVLGVVSDPFGETETEVIADAEGLIIGRTNLPVINEGDGLVHIAKINRKIDATATIDSLTTQLEQDPLFDEDEII